MIEQSNRAKCIVAVLVLIAGIILTACQQHPLVQVQATTPSFNLPTMNLTLVAANGTQLVLNTSDIANLPPHSGDGGFKKQTGMITDLGNYTGVPLVTLCKLVGGINSGESLRITASDSYSQNFTYSQVNGDFVTYDNVTGGEAKHNQSLTPILAYYFNGENVSDGPLRLAIVGPEGMVTDAPFWVRLVVKLEILSSGVPEFSTAIIVGVFMTATIVTAVSARATIKKRKIA